MSVISIPKSQGALGSEVSIIGRREIEPLLEKARIVLIHYYQALNCSVSIQDRAGLSIKVPGYENRTRCCDFCRKYIKECSARCDRNEWFCGKMQTHTESQHKEDVYVYSCEVGFTYWSYPLFRNGHYAGVLTAGQVLSCERKTAEENFLKICKDKIAAENFSKLLEDVPEKTHEEIQAMAKLLKVCAGEISGRRDVSDEMIRQMLRQEGNTKNRKGTGIKEFDKTTEKKNSPPGITSMGKTDTEYPLEKERMLLAAFRRGDREAGGKILRELMNSTMAAAPENFEVLRFRAIELMVLLSRSTTTSEGSGGDILLEAGNRHLRRIQESKTPEELVENLNLVADRMAGNIFSFQGIRHASVLRKAERYIWENYARKLSLDEIAKASGLSAPYFSTIFKEEMGENLCRYLNRLRVEKAGTLLTETEKPLNEIAGICGFEDQSWFSKIFKNFTGISPGKYRERGGRLPLRMGKGHTKDGQDILSS